MKRELAFALEARSQFSCFVGRTRSTKSPPAQFTKGNSKERSSNNRSKISIDEVHVGRRSKRVKTGIPDGDSINVDKSKADEESAAPEVVKSEQELALVEVAMGEEESAEAEVAKGKEESAAAVVAKGVKEGTRVVYMKRKNSKIIVNSSIPKRFTRSALKENEDKVKELGTPTRNKLELKMSKKIGLGRMPKNMRELLETGLLEGFSVCYNLEGKKLQGVIKGAGILCSCNSCMGTKVISPSRFELHAYGSYRHAILHICLENGKSLSEVLEVCKASALEPLEVALQTVISSLPSLPVEEVKEPSMCTNCNGSFEPSSSGNMLTCDSCLNKEPMQAEPRVATDTEVRASSPVPEVIASTSLPIVCVSEKKRGPGRPRRSDSVLNSPKSAAKTKLKAKRQKRSTESASRYFPSQQKNKKGLTIKNQQLHWPVFEEGGLPDGTELTYVSHGKKLLDGYKLGHGIFCSCCKTEVSASVFEAHAGWASRKKPYENIYISNGVSLHEYAVSLKKNQSRSSVKFNDDLCRICWDGGDLLLCDGCPRSFHQECAEEPSIPRGKWWCKYCKQSLKFVENSKNATVAGRVAGEIDPIEQITQRCIRIMKTPENIDLVACVLCRGHDFSKAVFNDRTVIVCDQCEKEYHIGCLRDENMANLEALPKGNWFCCNDCERIHSVLQNLLAREPEKLSDDLLSLVREKEKQKNNGLESTENKSEMKFVLLSGKNATRETRPLLTQTIDIFHEGFDPIIDATSGRDFIPSMVYGRKIWSQDFAGMLCAILTIDSNVVSAGTLRVFGHDIAELPIVATSKCNQGKGYFHVLFGCIERLLASLKVKKIVLPAADEAKSIWTKLGFETIEPQQLSELRRSCTAMMTFKGTSMLHKEIPEPQNDVEDAGDGNIQVVDGVEDGGDGKIPAVDGVEDGGDGNIPVVDGVEDGGDGNILVVDGVEDGGDGNIQVVDGVEDGGDETIQVVDGVEDGGDETIQLVDGVEDGGDETIQVVDGVEEGGDRSILVVNGVEDGGDGNIQVVDGVEDGGDENIQVVDGIEDSGDETIQVVGGVEDGGDGNIPVVDGVEDGGDGNIQVVDGVEDGGDGNVLVVDGVEDGGDGNIQVVDCVEDGGDGNVPVVDGVEDGGDGNVQAVDGVEDGGDGNVQAVDAVEDGGDGNVQVVDGVEGGGDGNVKAVDGVEDGGDGDIQVVDRVKDGSDGNIQVIDS